MDVYGSLTHLSDVLCRYNAITGEWAQDQIHLKMGAKVRMLPLELFSFCWNACGMQVFNSCLSWLLTAVWERRHEGVLQNVS